MLLCNDILIYYTVDILYHNKLGMGRVGINAILFISTGREQPEFRLVNVKARFVKELFS